MPLVLVLFLGSSRTALIAALTIPVSLLAAFILMRHFHIPANVTGGDRMQIGSDGLSHLERHQISCNCVTTPAIEEFPCGHHQSTPRGVVFRSSVIIGERCYLQWDYIDIP